MAKRQVEATLRAYEPSLREQIYQTLAGTEQRPSAERASFARGLAELAEFVPGLGNVLAGQEAYRRGDTKGMAMAMMPLPGARAPHRIPFDENMFQAFLRGKFGSGGARRGPVIGAGGESTARMMDMGYTAEDLGQAVAPYREGGLVYEPVGGMEGPRTGTNVGFGRGPIEGEFTDVFGIGGPRGAVTPSYGRGPIEGEFTDVYGIPYAQRPGPSMGDRMGIGAYQYERDPANMDFGVMRDGMEMAGQPRRGLGAGAGLGAMAMMAAAPGYLADTNEASGQQPVMYANGRPVDLTFNPDIPIPIDRGTYSKMGLGPVTAQNMELYSGIQPTYHNPFTYGPPMPKGGATALSGQAPGAGSAFEEPRAQGRAQGRVPAKGRGAKGKGVPMPPRREGEGGAAPAGAFEPNLNYLITAAIDRMLGQREAERGREFQQYYERNPL